MCGIVGYFGKPKKIKKIVEKLKMLEYRGYDSAGIFAKNKNEKIIIKSVGNIDKLISLMPNDFLTTLSIAHTRWATHGEPNEKNCHPHISKNKKWAIVHNGIIENYIEMRSKLKEVPESDTDTAVLSQLLEESCIKSMNDFIDVFSQVDGSFAIVAINEWEDKMYLAKRKSPLYIAKTNTGFVAASDPICFLDDAKDYYSLDDNEFALVENNEIKFYNNNKIVQKSLKNNEKIVKNTKNTKFNHFMLKEIYEQPKAVLNLINTIESKKIFQKYDKKYFKNINKIKIIGCGTAYHAGLMGAKYFEEIAGIQADAEIASEFIYKSKHFIDDKTLIIAVSQSGETADTLKAVEIVKKYNAKVVALTNVEYSTIVSMVDDVIPVCAGPEKAVASTKAYVCQLCMLYAFSSHLGNIKLELNNNYLDDLKILLKNIKSFDRDIIDKIAKEIKDNNICIFLGKDLDYVSACEASLKLKEVSYINSSSYPSGELKHGFLALVEKDTPLFVFALRKNLFSKTLNSANEAMSRGAKLYIISNNKLMQKNANNIKIKCKNEYLAQIEAIIPMQYLAYKVSVLRNINPDQPRNLAKSVTVE